MKCVVRVNNKSDKLQVGKFVDFFEPSPPFIIFYILDWMPFIFRIGVSVPSKIARIIDYKHNKHNHDSHPSYPFA